MEGVARDVVLQQRESAGIEIPAMQHGAELVCIPSVHTQGARLQIRQLLLQLLQHGHMRHDGLNVLCQFPVEGGDVADFCQYLFRLYLELVKVCAATKVKPLADRNQRACHCSGNRVPPNTGREPSSQHGEESTNAKGDIFEDHLRIHECDGCVKPAKSLGPRVTLTPLQLLFTDALRVPSLVPRKVSLTFLQFAEQLAQAAVEKLILHLCQCRLDILDVLV